jgi:replicative DNA helicase
MIVVELASASESAMVATMARARSERAEQGDPNEGIHTMYNALDAFNSMSHEQQEAAVVSCK